jgi:hypothetical protein
MLQAEELRQQLAQGLPPVMVWLAIAIATARVFRALKHGLGRAYSCGLVQVNVKGQRAMPAAARRPPRKQNQAQRHEGP